MPQISLSVTHFLRDLVAACHLKPLEKGDDIERMISANQIWNSAIQNKSYPQISSKTAPAAVQVSRKKHPVSVAPLYIQFQGMQFLVTGEFQMIWK